MKALIASLVALVFAGFASANVTVSGTGKVTYVPNLLYLSVGVSSDAKTADEVWQKNEQTVKKMFEVLKTFGIDPKDMKTTGLNISPRYVTHKDAEPELVGYTATYDLSVTVRKLDESGRVMDALVKAGANRQMNIALGHSDIEQMMDEARTKAAQDARKKAELYVNASAPAWGKCCRSAKDRRSLRPTSPMSGSRRWMPARRSRPARKTSRLRSRSSTPSTTARGRDNVR